MKTAFLIFIFLLIPINTAFAQTMSNNQYIIKMGNLNSISGNVSGSGYKLSETSGQTSPGLFTGTNYTVKAGFQYVRPTKIAFSFTISQNLIDFGTLTPTNPVSRTVNLTISSAQASGFSVTAMENHPLTSSNSNVIVDTACDNGDCTFSKASLWTGTLTYGFGYRCDDLNGTNCVSGFSDNFFKPFSLSPTTQTIMTSTRGGTSRKSQITYKVNVAGTQPAGIYTNVVTYIASPGF